MPLDTNEPYGSEDGPGHPDREPRHEWTPPEPTGYDPTAAPTESPLYVHVSAPSTNDAELDAMRICLKACEGLNNQAKVRVCTWLTERLGAWRTVFPTGYPIHPPPVPVSPFDTP